MTYKPEILHSGCDGLTVAIMGKLPDASLNRLEAIRAEAHELGHDLGFKFGETDFNMMPQSTSSRQGYRFQFHTGRDGIKYQVKRSGDASQWNIRARVSAMYLAVHGIQVAHKAIYEDLWTMDAQIMEESVSNVDFCVDIQMDAKGTKRHKVFRLKDDNFIHHSKAKKRRWFGDKIPGSDDFQVIGGRYIETVTIGSKGSRQLCVYNKRTEQIAQRKGDWFGVWGREKEDCPNIWRVEFRFGRDLLRDWNIRTLHDINASYGDILRDSLNRIRYIEMTGDSNLSRCPNHPFWDLVIEAFSGLIAEASCGLVRGKITAIMREDAKEVYSSMIKGMAATLSLVMNIEDTDNGLEGVPDIVADMLRDYIKHDRKKFDQTRKRAKDRLIFIRQDGRQENGV